jgi:hypothetical protein
MSTQVGQSRALAEGPSNGSGKGPSWTPEQHAAQRKAVAASLLLAPTKTERNGVYARRAKRA